MLDVLSRLGKRGQQREKTKQERREAGKGEEEEREQETRDKRQDRKTDELVVSKKERNENRRTEKGNAFMCLDH